MDADADAGSAAAAGASTETETERATQGARAARQAAGARGQGWMRRGAEARDEGQRESSAAGARGGGAALIFVDLVDYTWRRREGEDMVDTELQRTD